MKYLFDSLGIVGKDMAGKHTVLFLDYDGTLAPIAEKPGGVSLPSETKDTLWELAKILGCKLAIISGRELGDLKKMVDIQDIVYAGNHGLEIEGPKINFKSPITQQMRLDIKSIKKVASRRLSKVKGILIEDKGLTLSVHYRLVVEADVPLVKEVLKNVTQTHLIRKRIRVKPGKKVFEIRPPIEWDKGKVVLWLLARQQFLLGNKKISAVYIGDDVTDEDAFKALRGKGITIFVGKPKDTYADYYLRDTDEVLKFLKMFLKLQKGCKICRN
jgi:trehalose 6-phosphate phosphatase